MDHCSVFGLGPRMTCSHPFGTSTEVHPLRGITHRLTWDAKDKKNSDGPRASSGRFEHQNGLSQNDNRSGVSVEDIVTFTLSCSEASRLRERRLQDESSDIFAHTTSADTFSNELTKAATHVKSHFESSVSETFNFTVEVAVTVTADDDDDGIPVLQVVEEHVSTMCRVGVGRKLGSSVACPRGAGRGLRRRITCRCGADRRMSRRVTCPSTKSCTADTESRVHALLRPRCLYQVTRLVGGSAENRAEDLRAVAYGEL